MEPRRRHGYQISQPVVFRQHLLLAAAISLLLLAVFEVKRTYRAF